MQKALMIWQGILPVVQLVSLPSHQVKKGGMDPVNLPAIPFFRRQRVEHVEILMAAVDDMSRQ